MKKDNETKGLSRRKFLGASTAGVAAAVTSALANDTGSKGKNKKYAMVIDRHRCTGCGGCTIACKIENNVPDGIAWAYRISGTTGTFPNVRYDYTPTLCNHCSKAPCVRICPSKAMHKSDEGITKHDPNKCIGCKSCIAACPYVVISRNNEKPHSFWRDGEELLKGGTGTAKDLSQKVSGTAIPYYNPDREANLKNSGIRKKGIVEKCTFCDHRIKDGKLPYCVDRCPSGARIFGDLNDPNSEVNKLLGKHAPMRLKEHLGTEPNVYYIREFNPAHSKKNRGSV